MRRLWLGVSPSSHGIAQDTRKVAHVNLPIIKEHEGTLVPDLGGRRRNRCPNKTIKSRNWGRLRARKNASEHKKKHVYPDDDATRTNVISKDMKVTKQFDIKVELLMKSDKKVKNKE